MIYAVTVYCYLGPKLELVVRKCLARSQKLGSCSSRSVSEVKGYSDWKYNEFPPLVMLALSGPEENFQWLLSQLLRYSFCGVCGNEMEGLALITRGQKSLFPHWLALHHLFCYHLYWCGDAWKEHVGFMFVPVLLWSGIYSGSCTGTQEMNVSPSSLSLGGVLEGHSACTPGGNR